MVIDASAALSLVLPDESSVTVASILEEHDPEATVLVVPSLWWYETTNVLMVASRRGRIDLGDVRTALSLLARLPDETVAATSLADSVQMLHHASRFAISAYDSAYLAVAESTGSDLLTLDDKLRSAARDLGISVRPGS